MLGCLWCFHVKIASVYLLQGEKQRSEYCKKTKINIQLIFFLFIHSNSRFKVFYIARQGHDNIKNNPNNHTACMWLVPSHEQRPW